MEIEDNIQIDTQAMGGGFKETDSLELTKNTKGFNWKIKILGTDFDRLKELNCKFEKEYGSSL